MKNRNKVRYVFLDYDKFLYEFEFINTKPIERGLHIISFPACTVTGRCKGAS